jgi:hypothetical protein
LQKCVGCDCGGDIHDTDPISLKKKRIFKLAKNAMKSAALLCETSRVNGYGYCVNAHPCDNSKLDEIESNMSKVDEEMYMLLAEKNRMNYPISKRKRKHNEIVGEAKANK